MRYSLRNPNICTERACTRKRGAWRTETEENGGEYTGEGIKFSKHCDGHKPPDLCGACAQPRRCRRRKSPRETQPDWMRGLDDDVRGNWMMTSTGLEWRPRGLDDVRRATAPAAGLLRNEMLKSNSWGWAGNVGFFSKGKRSVVSLSDLHHPLASSASANGWLSHVNYVEAELW